MPTYQQAAFLPRALGSLARQTFPSWELVIVNDGSCDETDRVILEHAPPGTICVRLERNQGLGAALNVALTRASGRYVAYLPSDDVYAPYHLDDCVSVLAERPEIYLAYGGVRWYSRARVSALPPEVTPMLRHDLAPGEEHKVLNEPSPPQRRHPVPSGNLLALVQVVHRRIHETGLSWVERSELVSDSLEFDYWKEMLTQGCRFAYTGRASCEWGDHPNQRHKIISGRGAENADWRNHAYGISRYRQYYRVPESTPLNWQPSVSGAPMDERVRYERIVQKRSRPDIQGEADPLRILLVGSLALNPDRVVALAERGHKLYGLWMPDPHFWDTAGPLPFGFVDPIKYDSRWRERVESIKPDAIYSLLNWQAIPFIHGVFKAELGIPFVFHFKESPFAAMQAGYWSALRDLVLNSDGRIFSTEELRLWFEYATGRSIKDRYMVLDGDLPKADWMTSDWSRKLSDADGEIHTVCIGRTFLEPVRELADRGIHVHLYTHPYMRYGEGWSSASKASPWLHLHDPILPHQWVSELSQYDAGWLHVFKSTNNGDLQMADWNDLNTPSRLASYAIGGVPWLMRHNIGHRVSVETVAAEFGMGIAYSDLDDLEKRLRAEMIDRRTSASVRRHRQRFTFDYHVDSLADFLRGIRK